MELLARLPQTDLARLHVGAPVTVTPVGSNRTPIRARVWQISPIIDPQTRQGIARILVPYQQRSAARRLRLGARSAPGSISAPLLPESAVLTDDAGTYVMIIGPNNTVAARARAASARSPIAASSSPRA